MIPDIAKISTFFDAKPVRLQADTSFDFTCLKGRVSGADVVVLINQVVGDRSGSPMTRIEAISSILDEAARERIPVVWVVKGIASGQSQELAFPPNYPEFFVGKNGSGAYLGAIFRHRLVAPQIAIIDQEITSSRALALTSADLLLMHKGSALTIGRPSAVHSYARQTADVNEVGSALIHKSSTGLCALEWSAFEEVAAFLKSLFKKDQESSSSPFSIPSVPMRADIPFDISTLLQSLWDSSDTRISLWSDYAPEVLCELGHVNGRKCGIIANNCLAHGGFITIESVRKMSRFIRLTERLAIPTISLVDCAGLYSDSASEEKGIFESAGDLLSLLAQKHQAHICVAVRRAYSAGLYLMGGGNFSKSRQLALPTAKLSIYGPKILHKEISGNEAERDDFSRMLHLHDHPELMEQIGHFKVVAPDDLKRELVFDA